MFRNIRNICTDERSRFVDTPSRPCATLERMPAEKPRKLRKRYGHAPARASDVAGAIGLAPWVQAIDNACLYEVVVEALTARASAVRHAGKRATIAAADTTLAMVADGRVTGDRACKKAAVALRKYVQSYSSEPA
jgi:hypothetical protein